MTAADNSTGLFFKSLSEIAGLIESRQVSPVELTEWMLERISGVDVRLHSYITVSSDLAREQARAAEKEIAAGRYLGPLHGVPIAAKDIFYTRRVRTTCGSRILADFTPDYDATAIDRLFSGGAVLLGKLALTEFAGIGYSPDFAPAINPWSEGHWTGSSSSGSGVATAGGLCYGSLGTDTGGSIRFPSSACGVVGIKPTNGTVSRYGVFPLADTLDHVGPMARRVEDVAIMLQVMAGFDWNDPSTRREGKQNFIDQLRRGVEGLKIGIDHEFCSHEVDQELTAAVSEAVLKLEGLGASISQIDLSGVVNAPAVWGTIFTAECGASHEDLYRTNAADYSAPFRAFLAQAPEVSGVQYVKAAIERRRISRAIDDQLQGIDLIVCPSMAVVPMPLGGRPPEEVITPEVGNRLLKFTSPFSLSGSPALSIPCGFTTSGLPLGMQLVGAHGREDLLLRAGYAYEQATGWHLRHPRLT